MKTIVIALGGNALQEANRPATADAELRAVERTSRHIVSIMQEGYRMLVVHGNGPQVGRIVLQNETANAFTPSMPFDVCGAMSQGMIGYHIQQGISRVLKRRHLDVQPVTVVTQVIVDAADPPFRTPSKPIGLFYSREEAQRLSHEKGWYMKEDAGRGWRRVVPSPQPVEIVEKDAIRTLMDAGFLVISVGGGGIPVIRNRKGELEGVAAVIDKDYAGEKLAEEMDADILLILTATEKVSLRYNQPDQTDLDHMTCEEAKRYIAEGHFAPGSMLPKVESAVRFVSSKQGRACIITSLDKALEALRGEAGTTISDEPFEP